jgi:hypothetical protein
MTVHAADVLVQVLFPREPWARGALGVRVGAKEGFLSASVHLVDLALVAEKPAAVGEALQLLAAGDLALVRPIMLVHVFAGEHHISHGQEGE